MRKYVVWGVGVRGKMAVDFLGLPQICAFLETNPKLVHTECAGRPVISFEDYLREYRTCHIIVTPVDDASILAELAQHHIENYSRLKEIIC